MIIAGTGHRPDKLGGYSGIVLQRLTDLARASLLKCEATEVISGMALGWDTALALAALELGLPLTAAIPFKGQESRWPPSSQKTYQYILSCLPSDRIVIVCEGAYSRSAMQKRNEWMVDHCDRLLALWNGSDGGTANCVRYAESRVHVVNVWKSWVKYSRL